VTELKSGVTTNRILLAAVVLLIILIVMFAVNAGSETPQYCVTGEQQEQQIRGLTFEAIDKAFREQVEHLFEIWMKDEHDQPRRAMVGMQIAISAYIRARKSTAEWKPSFC
jgi:hypothetical protein